MGARGNDEPSTSGSGIEGMSKTGCERIVDEAIESDIFIKFMIEKMGALGCKVNKNFFKVENCDMEVGGGFAPPLGIQLCHNYLGSRREVHYALMHELVHAYDHCRAADLDWTNLDHHACSEIRAASLSGDCKYWMEFWRGNWTIRKGHQQCVRRRAALSVAMNPGCRSPQAAAESVERMMDMCYRDTAPFDRIP